MLNKVFVFIFMHRMILAGSGDLQWLVLSQVFTKEFITGDTGAVLT